MDRDALVEYIRQAAIARGIDPDIAVRVAESEGLNADPAEGWQSQVVRDGRREESYGPFQLFLGGGLGNVFMEQTGLDPRDPSTVREQIDFALDQAADVGWGPWYGAARVGIGEREGLPGPNQPRPRPDRTASEALVNGDDLEDDMLRQSLPQTRPQPRPDREDNGLAALQYLDLQRILESTTPPRARMTDLGVRRGSSGSGTSALRRLGIASLA